MLLALSGRAQLAVQGFRLLENDLTAQVTHPEIDQNGQKAALIKVVTTQTGFEFEGGMLGIVKTVQKTAEVWVYVPAKAKAITIKHPQLGVLRNYAYPVPIEGARTYELVLVSGTVETVVKPAEIPTQWLVINTTPEGADVYINDQPAGRTPYQNELPLGRYTYRLGKELYLPEAGVIELTGDGSRKVLTLSLNPNFGTLQLSSEPEGGARVLLDGIDMAKTTPCTIERVPAGEHTVTLSREWYATTTRRFTMEAGKTLPLRVSLEPTYAEVVLTAPAGAEILVNGVQKGTGSWKGRLTPAVYTFEARLASHRTATERRTVVAGQPMEVTLTPQPITGQLKVVTTPFDARIALNGKEYGTTPSTLRNLLVGDYTLTLAKPGYGTVTRTVTVAEGQTTEVAETLPTGLELTIASTPAGAQLWVDGTPAGTTPVTTTLAFGNHTLRLVNGKREVTEAIAVSQGGKTRWEYNVAEFKDPFEGQMVFVKGGTFTMGCTAEQGGDCGGDERPAHRVAVGDFYLGKYEVTQAQWRAVMGSNPSFFKGCDRCPVENVSWDDAQEFIRRLNQLTGKRYRLPTEAEWEYAARGGELSRGYKYAGSDDPDAVAWYDGNSGGKTHPVGGKTPNELGLYDMTGNVWEWCQDWYGSDYYSGSPSANPQGPASGSFRVYRGGSWYFIAKNCRVADRFYYSPDYRSSNLGFRLCLVP
jgi:formylglycine-generating enzyme required for sulfatase activity